MTTIPPTTPRPTRRVVDHQGPPALVALVQHIHTHGLGLPLSIHPPRSSDGHFEVVIVSTALDAWTDSGLTAHRTSIETIPGRNAGRRWERIELDGLLQPWGIRVQLRTQRALPDVIDHNEGRTLRLAEVPC